jgi:hypothetical protein
MPGDSFQATNAPLVLLFPDGSMIVFAPHTSARVGLSGRTPVLALESGSAHYELKTPPDGVKFLCRTAAIDAKEKVGDLRCGEPPALPARWWAADAAAGVGAVAMGIVLSQRNGPPVSPTECSSGRGQGSGLPPCR